MVVTPVIQVIMPMELLAKPIVMTIVAHTGMHVRRLSIVMAVYVSVERGNTRFVVQAQSVARLRVKKFVSKVHPAKALVRTPNPLQPL